MFCSEQTVALNSSSPHFCVVSFIQDYTARTGFSPSLREIADGCGLSLNAVFRYVERLNDQGRVTRIPGQARSLRVVGPVGSTRRFVRPTTGLVWRAFLYPAVRPAGASW